MDKFVPDKPVAPPEEVASALANMTPADMVRLGSFARVRTIGIPEADWQDLLHEAIQRALSGARKWPTDISFLQFMRGAIRSVAHEWRTKSSANSNWPVRVSLSPLDADIVDDMANPEAEVAAREGIAAVQALFEGDAEALGILEGLAIGLTPAEIQESYGMNIKQYATAQKRIRRNLAKAIDKGLR